MGRDAIAPVRRGPRPRPDAGMVTAELAVAIPALALVLGACLGGVAAGVDQVRVVDAARLASRAAARGEPPPRVHEIAVAAAPAGAEITVQTWGRDVAVVVTSRTGGWGGFVPSWTLSSTSVTPVERAAP